MLKISPPHVQNYVPSPNSNQRNKSNTEIQVEIHINVFLVPGYVFFKYLAILEALLHH